MGDFSLLPIYLLTQGFAYTHEYLFYGLGYNPIVLYFVAQVLPAFTIGSSFSGSCTHLTYSLLWALLLLLLLLFFGAICFCGLICVLTRLESVVLVICFCGSFAPSLGYCSDVSLGNSVSSHWIM